MLLLAFVLLATAGASAQSAAPSVQQPTAATAASTERVPVPEPSEKALAYHRSGTVIWIASTVWGLLLPFAILWTGFSARMRDWARVIGRKWFFVVAVYWVLFTLVSTIVDLPRAYYVGFVRQHAYDLSNQTIAKWASDQMANLAITLVIGGIALWVPYLLLRKSPKRWWLYTSLAAVPFIVAIVLVQPLWIDPLFNTFGPMKDKALEADILRLADRSGIEGGRVFEVAKSEDTKQVNAYVNGFGATKRIVLWDTILKALDRRQLLVVMGHEMGHYVLGHVWKLIILLSLTILGMTYAIHRLAGALIRTHAARFGFTELGDVASLPLVLVLVGAVSLVTDPLSLAVSRYFEHEADRFAVEITRDNYAAATAFVILQQENLAVPRPGRLYTWFRDSHPPIGDRIDFFNDYRPWESGQPLVYANRFK
jgi:Zn-dependent protease with chaperone function